MRDILNHTPKLNPHKSGIDAGIDPIVEALFAAYCDMSLVAQQSNGLADGIAAGRAWARFIGHFEKLSGVSAGGSI